MIKRGRRIRETAAIRAMVRENILTANDFIYPIFVVEGENIKEEIKSMEGNYHWSIDRLNEVINEVVNCGIRGIILFGIPDVKDECGSSAYDSEGIVQRAIKRIRELSKECRFIQGLLNSNIYHFI